MCSAQNSNQRASLRRSTRTSVALALLATAVAVLVVLGSTAADSNGVFATTADIVFLGGAVYNVDPVGTQAAAVAVAGNRISYVGDDTGARQLIGVETLVVELNGRSILPGFHDSHIHPASGGLSLDRVRLDGLVDRNDVFTRIQEYAERHPDRPWVVGGGWLEAAFKPSGVPDRQMLDELVPDRPALLRNASGHQGWANSQALEIAGIKADTPDPPNGRIDHDEHGEPSGILQESAQGLVAKHVPPLSEDEQLGVYRAAFREMARYGITSIMDASSSASAEANLALLEGFGELTVRVIQCQRYSPVRDDNEQIAEFIERREVLGDGQLQATCIKIGLDGIIEHHTASVLEPYVDMPGDRGPIFVEPERLRRLVTRLDAEGFQVQIHAIADRSAREALNAFEAARDANGRRDARHHIAHLQLVDSVDIPRMAELEVVANMTPIWGRGDDWETVFAARVLGPERAKRLLLHNSILRAGARLAWGTDWPVTTISPMEGIETSVTRRYLGGLDPYGQPDTSWLPDERISLERSIAGYTMAGAYLAFAEKDRGSIEVGKLADLVVLETNLFKVPELEIHRVAVDMTLFDGRVIYQR